MSCILPYCKVTFTTTGIFSGLEQNGDVTPLKTLLAHPLQRKKHLQKAPTPAQDRVVAFEKIPNICDLARVYVLFVCLQKRLMISGS